MKEKSKINECEIIVKDGNVCYSVGIAVNKKGQIERCNKIKTCKVCFNPNVTKNRKCFFCKNKL